jgi:hypothetical protein
MGTAAGCLVFSFWRRIHVHQIQIDQEQGPATCLTCCQAETQVALVLRVCSDAGVKSRFTLVRAFPAMSTFCPFPIGQVFEKIAALGINS